MKRFTKAEQLFLHLFRRALWADVPTTPEAEAPMADEATWLRVVDVAVEQTCQGLLADALSQMPADRRPSKPIYFSMVNMTAEAEDRNRNMNRCLHGLFPMLERQGIPAWLLKGQGLARCYPQPLHRMSGDIDVFIPKAEAFDRAVELFAKHLPGDGLEEGHERTFHVDDIAIELHSLIVTDLNGRLRRNFPAWCQQQLAKPPVMWDDVVLPPVSFNAIFVFVHLARHYVGGGIGLRQVADWMRFLYVHRTGGDSPLDVAELERDIEHLGIKRLWQVFATLAVDYLGCPAEVMPLYDPRHHRDAAMVLRCIFDEGNFGHHDEAMRHRPDGFLLGKAFSFLVQVRRMIHKLQLFPRETLFCFPILIRDGLGRIVGRKA